MNKEELQKELKKVYDSAALFLQKIFESSPQNVGVAILNLQQSVWWAEKAINEGKPKLENA